MIGGVSRTAARPVFARVVGELFPCGQHIQADVQGAMNQILVQGHNLRLPDEAGSPGTGGVGARQPGQSAQAESTQVVFP